MSKKRFIPSLVFFAIAVLGVILFLTSVSNTNLTYTLSNVNYVKNITYSQSGFNLSFEISNMSDEDETVDIDVIFYSKKGTVESKHTKTFTDFNLKCGQNRISFSYLEDGVGTTYSRFENVTITFDDGDKITLQEYEDTGLKTFLYFGLIIIGVIGTFVSLIVAIAAPKLAKLRDGTYTRWSTRIKDIFTNNSDNNQEEVIIHDNFNNEVDKKFTCPYCNCQYSKDNDKCPHCGAPPERKD